ncbi:hypothetical protein ACFQER_10815 [Halomicroarcula sp. GCM10025894]|uniref:hypothetical protein n=1 Tax=Halomicroarcula sp. GCM10025894 TaxID=3252673 RepID=UPI00360FC66B
MKEIARRDALQAVAGLASVVAVGTVAGQLSSAPSTPALDTVPATADAVMNANVDALHRDDGLRTLVTAALQQRAQYVSADSSAEQPRNVDALLSDVEAEFETSPESVHHATVFGDVGGDGDDLFDGYAGVVLQAELSAEDVKSGIENVDDIDFSELTSPGRSSTNPSRTGPLGRRPRVGPRRRRDRRGRLRRGRGHKRGGSGPRWPAQGRVHGHPRGSRPVCQPTAGAHRERGRPGGRRR